MDILRAILKGAIFIVLFKLVFLAVSAVIVFVAFHLHPAIGFISAVVLIILFNFFSFIISSIFRD